MQIHGKSGKKIGNTNLHCNKACGIQEEVKVKKRIIYFGIFLLLLLIEIYIALFIHDRFVRPYVGDVLVVMVLYFLMRIFLPEGCRWLPLFIFVFAVGVEFLQYFNLVELLGLSDNRFMRIVLGSVFDIKDIICYGVGCLILQMGQYKLLYNSSGETHK